MASDYRGVGRWDRLSLSLSDEEYIVWLARLIWVLMLTVGVGGVLLLVGFLARKLQNKTRKTGDFNLFC